jgi:hypothetical protein
MRGDEELRIVKRLSSNAMNDSSCDCSCNDLPP